MKKAFLITITFCLLFVFQIAQAQTSQIKFSDTKNKQGVTIDNETTSFLKLDFSLASFNIDKITDGKGEEMSKLSIHGKTTINKEGYPDLPSIVKYIAVPQGATVSVKISSSKTNIYRNINIAPAQAVMQEYDKGLQMKFVKINEVYTKNAFYPNQVTVLSEMKNIRGVDAVMLKVTPFQYNPVTKELVVYKNIKIDVVFSGGNGQFGDISYRSRWFDPLINDLFINRQSLPKADYNYKSAKANEDFEYIIISPDIPEYLQWADSIKKFRTLQGIRTGIVTLTELGGNYADSIENYIDNAYNNWAIKPTGVLLIGDYAAEGPAGNGVVSPLISNSPMGNINSDNKYADVDNDNMPDVIVARMSARSADELKNMVSKFIRYERNPPTVADFYNKPLLATRGCENWYLLYTEVVRGFFVNKLNKNPETEYVEHSVTGAPSNWIFNGDDYVSLFGPDGLGYIESNPTYVTDYTGSTQGIIDAINNGAFFAMHRDHGMEDGWVHPSFRISDLSQLDNEMLTYVFSINCYTGAFVRWDGNTEDCFAEAIHKHEKGAVGVVAAVTESYPEYNEVFGWGMIDYMWPNFMPDNNSTPEARAIMPAFANAAGKYRLNETEFSIEDMKIFMINNYHYFGDVFSVMYSEVPQQLNVAHGNTINAGQSFFAVTADEGAFISLTVDDEIIATATATGQFQNIDINPQNEGGVIHVTITKQNYLRYNSNVNVGMVDISENNIFDKIFTVGPNPSNGFINIERSGKAEFQSATVYSLTGKMVYKSSLKKKNTINISNLTNGTYMLVIVSENGDVFTKKIIKE